MSPCNRNSTRPKSLGLYHSILATLLVLLVPLEHRSDASCVAPPRAVPAAPIVQDSSPSVVVLDFAEHGQVSAVEVMRTPGVWEGRILSGAMAGGVVMQVQTTVGEVLYAQGGDGSVLQSLPIGDGSRRVHMRSTLPGCGGAMSPEGADARVGDHGGSVAGNCDDGTVLDVLVKWTPTAQEDAGGAVAIRAVAESAIAMSNHAYLASGVNVYIRAVGYGITEPFSGDAGDALGQLRNPSDGVLDGIHAERDATGADLVALLTGPHPSYCGVAYLVGSDRPDLGFSVTVWYCVSNLTFTHEIGHNQGCCHAPGDGGGCLSGGIYPYSVGHRFFGSNGVQYRTVLAYEPGARTPRLSSPLVQYLGTPTGLDVADNARSVRETAATMASFRCAATCSALPLKVRSPMLAVPTAGGTVTFTATSVSRALPGTLVEISVSTVGDLNTWDETLSLRIGSTEIGVVAGGTGWECAFQSRTTSVPASLFNAAIGGGADVTFALRASAAVGSCAASEVSVEVRYTGTALSCAGDLNDDGLVNGNDLSVVLSAWGPCCNCIADSTGDGIVNGSDLTPILSGWGECPPVPPTLASVSPASGPTAGGTTIRLTGTRLAGVTSVMIGGTPATNLQVVNSTTVTAVTPAGTAGARDVTVTTPGGVATRTGAFTYANVTVPAWATLIEPVPDPTVVTDPAIRSAIAATGRAWRVRDTASQIELLLVPAGAFQRGCTPSQQSGCFSWESPVHQVTLTQPFYMGRYEVTQAQWEARMGSNPAWFRNASVQVAASQVPNRPVERVSWTAIQGFLSGTGLRLPTEAEWEFAYRAGTTTAFHSMPGQPSGTGDELLVGNVAWLTTNSSSQTRPVGQKPGNGLGLHDMSGNVWEWVSDWYSPYSSAAQTNPTGPASGSLRVFRGGSWADVAGFVRASYRGTDSPDAPSNLLGFRVARNP